MRRPSKPIAATIPAHVPIAVWISRSGNMWVAEAQGPARAALDNEYSLELVKAHMRDLLVPWVLGGRAPIRRRVIFRRVPPARWERG
jgi:hypothetical protein